MSEEVVSAWRAFWKTKYTEMCENEHGEFICCRAARHFGNHLYRDLDTEKEWPN